MLFCPVIYEILDIMIDLLYYMYEKCDLFEEEKMTQSTVRAKWKVIIWSVILAAFVVIFFGGGGPDGFASDRGRIVTVAILFGAGYGIFFFMMGATRSGKKGGLARDERDERLESRAGGISLGIILAYVYILSIALWAYFQDGGSVPAGWMWFLGYSTVFLGMIAHGILVLLIASGGVSDGEG
jgi:hypothetical protein